MNKPVLISNAQHKTITELLDKHKATLYHVEDTNVHNTVAVTVNKNVYLIGIDGQDMKVS